MDLRDAAEFNIERQAKSNVLIDEEMIEDLDGILAATERARDLVHRLHLHGSEEEDLHPILILCV